MPDQAFTDAIAERLDRDAESSHDRAAASWNTPHDDRLESLVELRRTDPEAYREMRAGGDVAIYETTHRAAVEHAFRWDATYELALEHRAAGATFTPELKRAIDTYAGARAEAERHNVLEAARRRAEKG